MTITEFAQNLASAAKNDLVDAVNQFRKEENLSVVFATGEKANPWFVWGDDSNGGGLARVELATAAV